MKITYGKFYMKSGNVIPFAAKKLEWTERANEIVSLDYHFVKCDELGIGNVNFINISSIESLVTEGSIEIED